LPVERTFDYGTVMRIVDADGHVAEGAALTVQCMAFALVLVASWLMPGPTYAASPAGRTRRA